MTDLSYRPNRAEVNSKTENIGARRLHNYGKALEDVSFEQMVSLGRWSLTRSTCAELRLLLKTMIFKIHPLDGGGVTWQENGRAAGTGSS